MQGGDGDTGAMPGVEANGIGIHYEVYGEGEPLVLLAGGVGFGASWGPRIPLVAEDFLTIVPDHRGTGRSGVPDGPYTIEDHAQDMAGMLRSIGCGPAHIVGSSTGGVIAQVMALDHL